ncbi:MAG: flavin reductase family protein [Candidatus Caldarchaeum sp.]|nr:flavin reductase family protein [Candidatus Caldarchaeum sp.]MDW8436044.1 flavin reductase family protein [Candidatus Caldarchaeum sp.]
MKKVSAERFHRLFYPQVAAVVTARHGDEVGSLLASSVMPTSFNPPMVAVALGKTHNTTRLVQSSNAFAVNWLSYEKVSKMEMLAQPTPPGVKDKLLMAGLSYRGGVKTNAPILSDASAFLECRVVSGREVGDHILYIGEVVDAEAVEDFEDYWRFRVYRPVLYVGSARPDWPKFVRFPLE